MEKEDFTEKEIFALLSNICLGLDKKKNFSILKQLTESKNKNIEKHIIYFFKNQNILTRED